MTSLLDYSELLSKISPTEEEFNFIISLTNEIKLSLEKSARELSFDVVVTPGGSTAKNTFIKGNHDIDMFIRFKSDEKNLSDMLEKIIKKSSLQADRVHGSRDYFQFEKDGFNFELVPVKYVTDYSNVENVTDMSPLHVAWVMKNLTPELQRDIRLAKQFCKAQNVYGAESYINGMSGHVLDILLIHYGSFENFIKEVSTWSSPVVIDHEHKHEDVFKSLNESKLQSPLIVVDPIDYMRNASAAISEEKFNLLISSAKNFLNNPSLDAFVIHPFSKEELISNTGENETLVILELQPLEGNKDVVGTKILKVFEFLQREISEHGFSIIRSGWDFNKPSHIYFYVDKSLLDSSFIRKGPPVNSKVGAKSFKEKHGSAAFEKDGFLFVTIQRNILEITDFIKFLMFTEYVSSRVSSVKLI